MKILFQKFLGVVALLATIPVIILEKDITATVMVAVFALPMIFSNKNLIG